MLMLMNPRVCACILLRAADVAPGADAAKSPQKKLIEFGWDEPDTAFIRQHMAPEAYDQAVRRARNAEHRTTE
jgi:hypothetical protein